jgi:hypothetical protein
MALMEDHPLIINQESCTTEEQIQLCAFPAFETQFQISSSQVKRQSSFQSSLHAAGIYGIFNGGVWCIEEQMDPLFIRGT